MVGELIVCSVLTDITNIPVKFTSMDNHHKLNYCLVPVSNLKRNTSLCLYVYMYKSGTESDTPVPHDPTRTKPPGNFKILPNHNKKR